MGDAAAAGGDEHVCDSLAQDKAVSSSEAQVPGARHEVKSSGKRIQSKLQQLASASGSK